MPDPNTERDPLEVLAAEYMERLRQGQNPDLEEYATRNPDLAAEIRDLFPTIAVTERLKVTHARSSDGRATLGAAQLERLGDFRIIREIGRGGMGVVFEAEQESLQRRVAVKVLPRQMLLDERRLKRFEREARIAANLHHTNIVEVFGVGEQDGFHYYVMQLIHGAGLDALIPRLAEMFTPAEVASVTPPDLSIPGGEVLAETLRNLMGTGPLKGKVTRQYWARVAQIGLQAAEALEHAHNQGVLHRDIKPANLLLDPQGTVRLADFGLAKAAQAEEVSLSRDVVGTFRYMAPEQFRGQAEPRSDIYSLGLTLYELLALRPAYPETDHTQLMRRITQGPLPPPPSELGLHVPRDLETIVLKSISPNPDHRYASAQAMADDLRRFLDDQPIAARRIGATERLARWCVRNKGLASLAGTTLVLLVMVAMVASIGYVRTRTALEGEASERRKAEATASLAIEALDRIFERVSPMRTGVAPHLPTRSEPAAGMAIDRSPMLSKEAAALLEEMLPFYDRLAQKTGSSDKLRLETARANQRVGAIRQRLGQSDQAIEAYRRAIVLYEQLRAHSPKSPAFNLGLAQIHNEIGQVYTTRRQVLEARGAHRAALALLETATTNTSSPDWRFELARTCYFLGTQERPLPAADPRKAPAPFQSDDPERELLNRSVSLLTSLASSSGNPEAQHLQALCYLEGARAEPGRGPGAGDVLAIEILERLVQAFPGNPDYAYDLSEAYARVRIPPAPLRPDDRGTIEDRLGKSVALLNRLSSEHPEVPDFPAAAARAHDKLGSFYRQLDDWGQAEREFRQAIALQTPLVTQFPAAPYYSVWMATFKIALADALLRRNQAQEARGVLEETISTLLQQLEQNPGATYPHELLALGYSRLELALRHAGDAKRAGEAAVKAEAERAAARMPPKTRPPRD